MKNIEQIAEWRIKYKIEKKVNLIK